MSRVAVQYKNQSDITIYKIVCFKNDKNEILIDNVREFLKNPNIESYEMIEAKPRTGNSEGGGKNYESKYEKESNKLPKAIATTPKQWIISDWPDLTQMDIFKN